jgi:hypothetical protein
MHRAILAIVLLAARPAYPQDLSADDIMKRVAANQDREQKDRLAFVYESHIKVQTRHTNGKLAREEITDYIVTPTPKGIEKKTQAFKGTYCKKGSCADFKTEPGPENLDGELVKSFRDDLTKTDSKDGVDKELFPLTTDSQKDLMFELAGEKEVSGRIAYVIRFSPKDRNDINWAGEALVDKEEFQPVWVYTRLSRRLPFAVRTLLGTDLPGLGFNTRYARIDKDIWFPVSFGTEFRIHAVFFINRTLTVSMENKNFKRFSADSTIKYGDEAKTAP